MKKMFIICFMITGVFAGAYLAHCQSLTTQQIQDLQAKTAEDQELLNRD